MPSPWIAVTISAAAFAVSVIVAAEGIVRRAQERRASQPHIVVSAKPTYEEFCGRNVMSTVAVIVTNVATTPINVTRVGIEPVGFAAKAPYFSDDACGIRLPTMLSMNQPITWHLPASSFTDLLDECDPPRATGKFHLYAESQTSKGAFRWHSAPIAVSPQQRVPTLRQMGVNRDEYARLLGLSGEQAEHMLDKPAI